MLKNESDEKLLVIAIEAMGHMDFSGLLGISTNGLMVYLVYLPID